MVIEIVWSFLHKTLAKISKIADDAGIQTYIFHQEQAGPLK